MFFIGVAIWRGASRGQVAQPPGDTIPSYAESQILRGLALDARVGTGGRARANYVIDGDVDADPPRIHPRRTVEGDAFDLDIETDLAAEDEEKDKVDKL
ncbi:MAG TPA: hypothetical protein VN903_17670 [Polyangia bacterium]|nr:hypothetical protein [Polyangia bacterium]